MEEFRICKVCGVEEPLETFYVARVVKGKTYRRHQCDECHYKQGYSREREIAKWLEDIKKTKSCQHCGTDDFRVLEFHHRGDKEFNVGDSIRFAFAKAKILDEIAKCDIAVCELPQDRNLRGQKESGCLKLISSPMKKAIKIDRF